MRQYKNRDSSCSLRISLSPSSLSDLFSFENTFAMARLQHLFLSAILSISVAASDPAQAASYASPPTYIASGSSSCSSTDWSARNLKTIQTIYDLTVYPKNVPIITGGDDKVPANLFSTNATGRFSPVGEFEGFADGRALISCMLTRCNADIDVQPTSPFSLLHLFLKMVLALPSTRLTSSTSYRPVQR